MENQYYEDEQNIKCEELDKVKSGETKKTIFVITKCKKVKNWSKEEDNILMKTAQKYKFRNWNEIAKHIPGRSSIQCTARYKRIKPGIVKGSWTNEEDEFLKSLLERYGKNWSIISKFMPSRNGKQIRDRFLNYLDPDIYKEKFSSEEDAKILELYSRYGSSWSQISKYMKGRTADLIKNRFYSALRKQVHCWDYIESLRKRKRARERTAMFKKSNKKQIRCKRKVNVDTSKLINSPASKNNNDVKLIAVQQNTITNQNKNYLETKIENNEDPKENIDNRNNEKLPEKIIKNEILNVDQQNNFNRMPLILNNLNNYQNFIYGPGIIPYLPIHGISNNNFMVFILFILLAH
jgi:hypothetical protein